MNPALPPLAAVPLVAALVAWRARGPRKRALGEAVALFALLALVLMQPHLAVSDGVPSGASLLGGLPPWSGAGVIATQGANPELSDLPLQVEPRLLFVREELRAGRLPLWNPFAFGGYPIWAAAQAAPLSPLTWIFAALPLELAYFALPFLRFLAAGLGAWLLARELGLPRAPALLAGALFELSGRLVAFALFPLGGAIALVPWILLGSERIARGLRGGALLALGSALAWTSGHPETAAFAAAGSLFWLLLAGGFARRPILYWAAGSLAGLFAAGVAILPFLLLLPDLTRYREALASALPLAETAKVLFRLVLPGAWGDPARGAYFGSLPYVPTFLYCGAFALPLAAVAIAALRTPRRDARIRRLTIFAATTLAVALAPPGIHHLFQLLPGLRHGIAHYFLPLALLALALLAAIGLERLAETSTLLLAGIALVLAGAGAFAWLELGARWREHGLAFGNLAQLAVVVAAPLLLLAARTRAARLAPALALLAAGELAFAQRGELPLSRAGELFPETPAIAALRSAGDGRLFAPRDVLPPNVATVYRIADLRGADAATPARVAEALGPRLSGDSPDSDPSSDGRALEDARLAELAVAFRMTPPGEGAPPAGEQLIFDGPDARLFGLAGLRSMVRFEGQAEPDRIELVERRPGRWVVDWQSAAAGTIVVADAFDRGWSAEIDGRPVAIDGSDPLLLRIAAGPGKGRLDLRYRPEGLPAGGLATLAGLAALALLARAERRLPASACLAGEAPGTIRAASNDNGSTR